MNVEMSSARIVVEWAFGMVRSQFGYGEKKANQQIGMYYYRNPYRNPIKKKPNQKEPQSKRNPIKKYIVKKANKKNR